MVTLLRAIESYPAVTLLMSTAPESRMLPEDAERLRGMAREAGARLTSEALPGIRRAILRPFADLAGPTTRLWRAGNPRGSGACEDPASVDGMAWASSPCRLASISAAWFAR